MDKKIWLAAFALVLLSGISFALSSYDMNCATDADCVPPLVCQDFGNGVLKCTQPVSVCSIMPDAYVVPPPTPANLVEPGGPANATTSLQAGSGEVVQSGSNIYRVGWLSDWNTAGIIGAAIAVSIIALAAIIGQSFNLPEVKAFADQEMIQAVISVLLIVGLIGMVTFLDGIAREAVNSAGLPISPPAGEPSYISAAKYYVKNLYDTASQTASGQLTESIRLSAAASSGISTQANLWLLLYAGASFRHNAGLSIPAERAGALFESASGMMGSLYAQYYFLDIVSYGIAPLFLLLGIVLRTFFFTRKLGGLLLAIGISLFIVYPLTYVFSWYTLNVTVYGERTVATADPYCPRECTARYPVAFFINSTSGEIKQFDSIQTLAQAGVNDSNWQSGNVDADSEVEFPGLVACRNLTNVGIGDSIAPNACGGCPDYCRDVPFPSGLPGCNIVACSSCNAGCKIMRQRDCSSSSSSCPLQCRTRSPVEDKCYFRDEAPGSLDVQPANLAVTCQGCGSCPSFCKFLTNASGTLKQVYENDPACSVAACRPPELGGSCPIACQYKTDIGKDTSCNVVCSDPQGTGAVCPAMCRVANLTDPAFVAQYDLTGLANYCFVTLGPAVNRSCHTPGCTTVCGITVPPADLSKCAAYPTATPPAAGGCTNCPEYCRFSNYTFVSPNVQMSDSQPAVPEVCEQGTGGRLDCSAGACGASCQPTATPVINATCSAYLGNGDPDIPGAYQCWGPGSCASHSLQSQCLATPSENCVWAPENSPLVPIDYRDPAYQDRSSCKQCPEQCRINGVESDCGVAGNAGNQFIDCSFASCDSSCRVDVPAASGGGGAIIPAAANGILVSSAREISLQSVETDPPIGPSDPVTIDPIIIDPDPGGGDPIGGPGGGGGGGSTPGMMACEPFAAGTACQSCPALCRRNGDAYSSSCPQNYCGDFDPSTGLGCTSECKLPDAPDKVCSGCFDVPLDCTYYPAVRTDCSEICSDEALAGPVNVAPDDYIRNLPGARGSPDVRNLGTLMVPAVVLPLFCIVIVVAFVRVFSPILGGDMEIPGLSRII